MPGGGLFSFALFNEQYFSLTTNQPTVLSAMAYQPSFVNWDKTENHIFKENKYKCNTERG